MWMMNSGTTTLDQILLMGKTTKDHEGLRFKGESSEIKFLASTTVVTPQKPGGPLTNRQPKEIPMDNIYPGTQAI